jgi:transketolase
MDSSERNIWVMIGDGETQEGQIWEAAMAADFHNAGNLNVIIDRNRIQNDDFMEVQMEIGDIGAKFQSFGWKVIEIDGHNMTEIVDAIKLANDDQNEPYAIVAHTVKGKGVSFMENNPAFHGKAPTDEELIIALEELS